MKHKFSAALLALVISASVTGCLDSGKSSSKVAEIPTQATVSATEGETAAEEGGSAEISESMELMRLKYADTPALESGPVIKLSNTSAKPGEMAEVTVSITGAEKKWNMCGIHITYPEVLKCKLADEEELMADFEPGEAIKANAGFIAMDWQKNLAPELERDHKRSVFFTTMFTDNGGKDGNIVTFFFKIPDDAQPGTVYDLGYYYMDTDMFRNQENDMSFEKYAFEHLEGGSITVR
ncbi:hypothetical protein [Ruminococcus flavefaciens]|uniref:hypothetical protein n=1 Tax=Ruminococcus flavefaciens TaxID=1265 RepID=UPI000318C64E|nr:hypothetical protein [Ruminococcus flavefaciens]